MKSVDCVRYGNLLLTLDIIPGTEIVFPFTGTFTWVKKKCKQTPYSGRVGDHPEKKKHTHGSVEDW